MKRISAFLLSLTLILTVISVPAVSYAAQTTDIAKTRLSDTDTYYSFDSASKTLTISGSGKTPDFTNTSGSSSSQPWFSWRSNSISHVVVENGVTSVGRYFFTGVCADDFIIADSVTLINSYAFYSSTVNKIDLPANLKTISNDAFRLCESLTQITIPYSTASIGNTAFRDCRSLEKVEFEKMSMKVTVSQSAFLNCPKLLRVDIPLNAKLLRYSFGFKEEKLGKELGGFTLGVYKDSQAYQYACDNGFDYVILDEMEIFEGDSITRVYDSSTVDDKMIYRFIPLGDAQYKFYSSGSTDVDCVLTDSAGNVIFDGPEAKDNSDFDLNFTVSCELKKGEVYYFSVSSIGAVGEYTVTLESIGIKSVYLDDWDVTYSAAELADGNFSVLEYIKTKYVCIEYNSGYVYKMKFSNGAQYADMTMTYNNELNDSVTCGTNKASVTFGDNKLDFTITVNHSYVDKVVEPTLKNDGYTEHTCVLCGSAYLDSFVDHLGTDVIGYLYLAVSPDGEIDEARPIAYAEVFNNDDKYICSTDKNGMFYVEYAYDYIYVRNECGPSRKVKITSGKSELGSIGIIYCDYNGDGYASAKDYAVLNFNVKHNYEYDISNPKDDRFLYCIDSDKDGKIEKSDYDFIKEFYALGKLDEAVYDNFKKN